MDVERLSDVERVMRINRHALDSKGQLKSFTEQYGEYALLRDRAALGGDLSARNAPELQDAVPFVLALNGSVFDVPEMAEKPLVLSNRAIKHIWQRHLKDDYPSMAEALGTMGELFNTLSERMRENVLVFQDDAVPNHLIFVLKEQTRNGNTITTIVEVARESKGIEVSGIVSNHGRRNLLKKVEACLDKDGKVYVNERTGAWLLALSREPVGDEPDASAQDPVRAGGTALPAGRPAAIRRLSEEYCRKFPDTEASRELRKGVPGSDMELLPDAPWDYLSSALGEVDEDVDVTTLGGDWSDYGKSVPWYVREAWERNEMTNELPCSSYIAIREGEYGIVHEIEVERGDAFAEAECSGGYNAAETALAEVAGEFAREHPRLECALVDETPGRPSHVSLRTRVTLGVFTPWNMDSAENDRVARDLCTCYDRVAERSRTIKPPNLIELEGSRPEGHQILTDSSGEEPTYLTGPDMHLAEVIDGRLEDLPDEAQRAWSRQSADFGPTNYLYEVRTWDEHRGTQATYGNLSEIYMTDDPETGLSHIDGFDGFEAPTDIAHRALEETARRFAWVHPDVTVLSGPSEFQWPSHCGHGEHPKEISRSFEVFTPINVPGERYQKVFWDQDRCLATIERRCREMEAEVALPAVSVGRDDRDTARDEAADKDSI